MNKFHEARKASINNDKAIAINLRSENYADFSSFKTSIESLPDFSNNNVKLNNELNTLITHIARSVERISKTL